MKRLFSLVLVVLAAVLVFLTLRDQPPQVAILGGKATAMQADGDMYLAGLTLVNAGGPDVLLGATSPTGAQVTLMNPAAPDAPLAIPGGSMAILARDGAHMMVQAGDAEPGSFIPVTLNFREAGEVATRLEVAQGAPMVHDMTGGVSETPSPTVQIVPVTTPSADGFEITLDTTNFTFLREENGAPHVPGEGHGHLYLNGLKLDRLYEPTTQIGALDPGTYTLMVSLNTHEHDPYVDDGGQVSSSLTFTIP